MEIPAAVYETMLRHTRASAPLEACGLLAAGPDGVVTAADIIYMVQYVFKGGPAPCDPCTIIPSLWECPC